MEIVKKIEPMFSPCFNDTRGLLEFEIVDGEKKKKGTKEEEEERSLSRGLVQTLYEKLVKKTDL